jgi:fatty-acyl-CoA synthase
VTTASAKAGATAKETELRNYARDHLAHFKCPQRIQFVCELPKTATGNAQKYVVRGKATISKQ